MPRTCAVIDCLKTSETTSLFKIPTAEAKRPKEWLEFLEIANAKYSGFWRPSKTIQICVSHFDPKFIEELPTGKLRIATSGFPTILDSKVIFTEVQGSINIHKYSNDYVLIYEKNNGGLFIPSVELVGMCKLAEQVIRENQANGYWKMNKAKMIQTTLLESNERELLKRLSCSKDLQNENHAIDLARAIISEFLTLRMHHIAKESTLKLNPTTNRNVCTKTVHFSGN